MNFMKNPGRDFDHRESKTVVASSKTFNLQPSFYNLCFFAFYIEEQESMEIEILQKLQNQKDTTDIDISSVLMKSSVMVQSVATSSMKRTP